jgi:hypothetical protein
MPMNRIQFQPGLSMAQFMAQYGTEEQCRSALLQGTLAERIRMSEVPVRPAQQLPARGAPVLPVLPLPASDDAHRRHHLPGHEAAAHALVCRPAPAHPGEEQRLCAGAAAPSWGVLPHRLADQAQTDAGDGRA